MSADNWQVCPRCSVLFPLSPPRELTTFREDYEIGTDMEAMEFYALYKGRCRPCGYTFEYRYTAPLPTPATRDE